MSLIICVTVVIYAQRQFRNKILLTKLLCQRFINFKIYPSHFRHLLNNMVFWVPYSKNIDLVNAKLGLRIYIL